MDYIKIAKINADFDRFLFFLKMKKNVGDPVWVLFLSNEATIDDFVNFNFDRLHNIRSKLSLLLLNQFSVRLDIETMHGHLRVETRHVFITPSEDIYIFSYKRYKVFASPLMSSFHLWR